MSKYELNGMWYDYNSVTISIDRTVVVNNTALGYDDIDIDCDMFGFGDGRY